MTSPSRSSCPRPSARTSSATSPTSSSPRPPARLTSPSRPSTPSSRSVQAPVTTAPPAPSGTSGWTAVRTSCSCHHASSGTKALHVSHSNSIHVPRDRPELTQEAK